MSASTTVTGHVADGWQAVPDVLRASIERGDDVGASVAVYHRGECVVDVAGGSFGADDDGRAYDRDTLQLVCSTTKGITAIAVAICVQRGLLAYDERVSTYWPEFAVEGKGDITVAAIGLFVADEIAGPLGVELWIGLPEAEESRVSPIVGGLVSDAVDPAVKAMIEQMLGPDTRDGRALLLSGTFAAEGVWNRSDVHAARSRLPTASPRRRRWPRCTRPPWPRSTASGCSTTLPSTSCAPRSRRRTNPICASSCRPRSARGS